MSDVETFEREVRALHRARGRRTLVKFVIAYAVLFVGVGVALAKDSLNGLYAAFGLLALVTGAGRSPSSPGPRSGSGSTPRSRAGPGRR